MRWRVLTLVSLGVNLALAAAWFASARRYSSMAGRAAAVAPPAPTVKTNLIVRRQFFSWAEVESPDYPNYIANLRDIGCPEQTIRDIIIAEVNALYAKRLATELLTPEQQWWRSEPDPGIVRLAAQKTRELNDERRALLSRLLGPAWESGDMLSLPRPSRPGIQLDGPVLGVLPLDVKEAIEGISIRSQDRLQAYLREAGNNPDPAQLAKLRQQTRAELAGILAPPQLEEYLLRYSQNAANLRNELGQLKYFNATPDEFRAFFRATDSFDQQLQLLAGSADPNSVLQRRALEQQRDSALKLALGADRFQQYALLHDPAYRDAFAAAQQAGTPEAVDTLYRINLASAEQLAAILANTNLTAAQKIYERKLIELKQFEASAPLMGQEITPEPPPLPPPIAEPPPPDPRVRVYPYVLGVGDTVASVAVRYGISIRDLRAANPNLDFKKLNAGDTVQVPDPKDLKALPK